MSRLVPAGARSRPAPGPRASRQRLLAAAVAGVLLSVYPAGLAEARSPERRSVLLRPQIGQLRLVAVDGRIGVSPRVSYGMSRSARRAITLAVHSARARVRVLIRAAGAARPRVVLRAAGRRHGLSGLRAGRRVREEHHPLLFSRRASGRIRAALRPTGALAARAGSVGTVTAAVRVTHTADSDADGVPEHVAVARGARAVRRLFAPEAVVPLGATPGSDPCGRYSIPASCVNVAGSTWLAENFWASNTQTVRCPSDHPNIWSNAWEYDSGPTGTTRYTDDAAPSWTLTPGWTLTVTDDNLSGHPYAYTPWIACSTASSGWGPLQSSLRASSGAWTSAP